MRQERTVQATIFEVFAGHQIGCELKTISAWAGRPAGSGEPGGKRPAARGAAPDRTAGATGGDGAALCAAQAAAAVQLRGIGLSLGRFGVLSRLCPPAAGVVAEEVGAAPNYQRGSPADLG